MSVRQKDNPELYDNVQERNLLRQYDLLSNCIEIGVSKGIEAFDKYTLWALNAAAVANIAQFGGRFREKPIYVGDHIPPLYERVPHLMDMFFSFIHENWDVEGVGDQPTALAAYALWRASTGFILLSRATGAPPERPAITSSACTTERCSQARGSFRSAFGRTAAPTTRP
jgi:hypothetical protein